MSELVRNCRYYKHAETKLLLNTVILLLNLHVHVEMSDIVMTMILSLTGTSYVKQMYGVAKNTKL